MPPRLPRSTLFPYTTLFRSNGEPWSEHKKLVWWDSGTWTGIDVPDFKKDKRPDYEPQDQLSGLDGQRGDAPLDRKSTRLNSSHITISYAVFCLKKKKKKEHI